MTPPFSPARAAALALLTAAGSASSAWGADAAGTPGTPSAPRSGIALQFIDPAVRVQDDFFSHLNGHWLQATEIPADKPAWGTFLQLREEVVPRLRALIEAAALETPRPPGSPAQQIGDLYASFMDAPRRAALGYAPLARELQHIRALKDRKGLPALFARLARLGVAMPYGVQIGQDARASTVYAAHLGQGGLGLPDRDYYLTADDARLAQVRTAYLAHMATMFTLAGGQDGAASAQAVLALETALAQAQWSKVDNRDPLKRYNKVALEQLATLAPGYDWHNALGAAGVGNKVAYLIVAQPSYITALAQLLQQAPLASWKRYCEWQLLRQFAPYLSAPFVAADFAFYGNVMTGALEPRPDWKAAVATVDGALGEALGQRYVAAYFAPARKARMEALVHHLLLAYRDSIDSIDWMGPQTRQEAQAKLAKFTPKIGYPASWRDYRALSISRYDLVGNVMRAAAFHYQRQLDKLGRPIDRAEWSMTPQTVNAYYNAGMNEIVFPAAILQPPFFDADADDAVNYGAIGAVIGHEISHGFDDKGSQSDGDGNLRDWWSAQDRANFSARAAMLVAQYSSYSPLPGYTVNGQLTLGENIADNSGLAIAYKAYQLSLHGQAAPVIDGLSGAQRFFMGFGQVWRSKAREAQQLMQLKTDPHAPGQFRANGTLKNQPAFYEAFGVHEGDRMYLPPAQRVTIW